VQKLSRSLYGNIPRFTLQSKLQAVDAPEPPHLAALPSLSDQEERISAERAVGRHKKLLFIGGMQPFS